MIALPYYNVMALRLETDRIRLRHLRKSDAENIFQYVRETAIAHKTLMPNPYKLKHAHDFIRKMAKSRRRKQPTDVVFVIELRETKKLVGMVGIHRINRIHNNAEVGYWLGKPFRGRGLMPEAVRLSLQYCFGELGLMRVYAPVYTTNKASCSVLKKCGFAIEGILRKSHRRNNRYKDSYLFSILRGEPTDEN